MPLAYQKIQLYKVGLQVITEMHKYVSKMNKLYKYSLGTNLTNTMMYCVELICWTYTVPDDLSKFNGLQVLKNNITAVTIQLNIALHLGIIKRAKYEYFIIELVKMLEQTDKWINSLKVNN
jgi:hypothetical protein